VAKLLARSGTSPSKIDVLVVNVSILFVPEAHPPSPILSQCIPYVSQNTMKMNIKEGKEKSHSPTMFMN
jgi:hypothetical protein